MVEHNPEKMLVEESATPHAAIDSKKAKKKSTLDLDRMAAKFARSIFDQKCLALYKAKNLQRLASTTSKYSAVTRCSRSGMEGNQRRKNYGRYPVHALAHARVP
jgi:hypothetical protein